jgi:hypothetical protein
MCLDDFRIYETAFTGTISGISHETCYGSANGSMTASYSYGISPVTYTWSNGDTTATIVSLAPGEYCVTMVDASGDTVIVCDTILALASAPLTAYVHPVNEWICTDSVGYLIIDSITGGAAAAIDCGISPLGCTGSEDTVQVDTMQVLVGGTVYPSPLGNWYWGARHQMVYRASELLAAGVSPGNLSGLAFYIDNMGTATSSLIGLRIEMGCTSDSVTTTFNEAVPIEVMAPTNVNIAPGWNWFDFDQPYYWNGVDNILIETCFNNSSYTNNPYMACKTKSYISSIWYRADNATVCGSTLVTGTSTNRPIIRFKNCAASPTYPYIYSWDNGSTADTTVVAAGTYTLTVIDGTGCEISLAQSIYESAPVNIDDITICETNPADYSASSTFASYNWSNGASGQTISITTGGTYYVDAVDSLGCPTSDTAYVTALPAPILSATSNDEIYGSDGYIDLLVYGAAFPFTIDWDTDGIGDADDTEDQFGLAGGDYSVVVTDSNGCYSSLMITVDSQVGIAEHGKSAFNVYPNPTHDIIRIDPVTSPAEAFSAEVLDGTGRILQTRVFQPSDIATLDLSGYESGIYSIRFNSVSHSEIVRVILE